MWKVLVTETIHDEGLKILKEAPDVELTVKTGMDKATLLETVTDMHAILTRSGTNIDAELLDAAPMLKVAGRAGVGVDNVDLAEASRRGVVVINAPTGNTLAATEQTMALMLSLIRRVPQAYESMRTGIWDRKRFMGHQLNGKKLLIIGLGRIGSQVAVRCGAFGMDVTAYDPYVQTKRAEQLGVTLNPSIEDALAAADVITLHVPLTDETEGMLDERLIRTIKRGAYLVNCARGGLVDEAACAEAVREGRLCGVAFDVYTSEPPTKDSPLLAEDIKDMIVLTPHLGANTYEAQSAVARIAASNMLCALRGEPYEHAVNLPFMEQRISGVRKLYLSLCRKLGVLASHMSEQARGDVTSVQIMLRGPLFQDDEPIRFEAPFRLKPYTVALIKGFLEVRHGAEVNYMIAPLLAQEKGIVLDEGFGAAATYQNLVDVKITAGKETIRVMGTVTEEGRQRVVCLDDYWLDMVPEGRLLIFQNHDRPGVIGKVGTLLGAEGVNIGSFTLGRKDGQSGGALALGVVQIDGSVDGEYLHVLRHDVDLIWALEVCLPEGL